MLFSVIWANYKSQTWKISCNTLCYLNNITQTAFAKSEHCVQFTMTCGNIFCRNQSWWQVAGHHYEEFIFERCEETLSWCTNKFIGGISLHALQSMASQNDLFFVAWNILQVIFFSNMSFPHQVHYTLSKNSCLHFEVEMLFRIAFFIFRHILATLHFNENVNWDTKTTRDGKNYVSVTYPKFKFGDEVVQNIPVPPTYGMLVVGCIHCC